MTLGELIQLIQCLVLEGTPRESEIRIGDQVESGPYLHASVGGVFRGSEGEIIFTANDDEQWKDESTSRELNEEETGTRDLKVLWKPTKTG